MAPRTADEIAIAMRIRLQTTLPAVFQSGSVAQQLIDAFARELAETEQRFEEALETVWDKPWNEINDKRSEVGLPRLSRPTAPWKITK